MSGATKEFDYILAGAGCAGLSLLYRLLKDPILKNKQILVVDKSEKKLNDRTWCYWEKGTGIFEPIVHHQWKTLTFYGTEFEREFELKEHRYKMIKGIDFYTHVLTYAKAFKNVVFKQEQVLEIKTENELALLKTDVSSYSGTYLFNSTNLFLPKITTENALLQHFEGWEIKTKEPFFDSSKGTLMDFRLDQKEGATFMYVLPTSPTEALVEYTLFSPSLLAKDVYKTELSDYIANYLKLADYEITHTEFGVIPMSLAQFSRSNVSQQIINIGTTGGFTKASSGYAFQFIQKNTQAIVENLSKGRSPIQKKTLKDKVFDWYDRTLLEVLLTKKVTGRTIFSSLFKAVPPEQILVFLDNESSLKQELKIMTSLPLLPFLKAGIKQLRK